MPPPPALHPSELKKLQISASKTTDESLESTRRMMSLCEESKEAGICALIALDEQGEQLDHIGQGLLQIHEDMREAEENLDGMEKCCGLCTLPCKKSSEFQDDPSAWKGSADGIVVDNQPQRPVTKNMVPSGGYICRITNDARENEMDSNLGHVSTMIGTLRNMAVDIGNEIATTNGQLDQLEKQLESDNGQVQAGIQHADKILKSS